MSSEDALLVIILVLFYLHLLNSILFYNYCTILLALLIVGLAQCSLYILIWWVENSSYVQQTSGRPECVVSQHCEPSSDKLLGRRLPSVPTSFVPASSVICVDFCEIYSMYMVECLTKCGTWTPVTDKDIHISFLSTPISLSPNFCKYSVIIISGLALLIVCGFVHNKWWTYGWIINDTRSNTDIIWLFSSHPVHVASLHFDWRPDGSLNCTGNNSTYIQDGTWNLGNIQPENCEHVQIHPIQSFLHPQLEEKKFQKIPLNDMKSLQYLHVY